MQIAAANAERIAAWEAAMSENERATIFQTPQWILRDLTREISPWILSLPHGVAPLTYKVRNSTRTLGLLGGDFEDVIAVPGKETDLLVELFEKLKFERNWDICDFRSLLGSSAILAPISDGHGCLQIPNALQSLLSPYHLQIMRHDGYAKVQVPATWPEYEAVIGKNAAYQIRAEGKRRTKFFGHDGLRQSSEETFEEDFAALVSLHTMRWNSKGLPGLFGEPETLAFLKAFCLHMLKVGKLRLYNVYLGTEPAGALLNFIDGNRVYFYASGFDAKFRKHYPVKVLFARAIQDCIESGPEEFNFLKGDEEYKLDWANAELPTYRLVIARKTIRGRLAMLALSLQSKRKERRQAKAKAKLHAEIRAQKESRGKA